MAGAPTWNDEAVRALERLSTPAFGASLVVKTVLGVLGIVLIVAPSEAWQLGLLLAWCVLGTAYILGVGVTLGLASRFPVSDSPPKLTEIGVAPRAASVLTALVSVAIGVYAAVEHTLVDKTSPVGWSANLIGIWAMILAWFLLQWGFTQIHLEQYYRSPTDRTLQFPHDGQPGVLEFAYFAYGIAVSLAVSDVVVLASRARALVLLQSVLTFFFNGLIIVTALAGLAEAAGLR